MDLPDFVDDVLALLEYLSIQKCVPVGLSVGGMIAQVLASLIPEKIEKLVLCDTRHKIGNAQIWNDRIAAVKEKGITAISDGVMQRWFSEKFRSTETPAEWQDIKTCWREHPRWAISKLVKQSGMRT